MDDRMCIEEYLQRFDQGDFNSPDVNTQIDAGWFDWFCKDTSLRNKTYKLTGYLKQIVKSKKIDVKNNYVFFKNNCPLNGSLYDDFRICDPKNGDVIYTITPRSGHKNHNGKGSVWGRENEFKEALFEGSWSEIKRWFLMEEKE